MYVARALQVSWGPERNHFGRTFCCEVPGPKLGKGFINEASDSRCLGRAPNNQRDHALTTTAI